MSIIGLCTPKMVDILKKDLYNYNINFKFALEVRAIKNRSQKKGGNMVLQIKVLGEDYELYKKLKEKGYNVRLVKNAVILEEEIGSGTVEIPEVIDRNFEIYFKDAENGGGMSHWGHSHIVCGFNGEKLVPFHIKTWGHRAGGEHAVFAVRDRIVTIDYVTNQFAKIIRYEAKLEDRKVIVKVEKLWEGYPNELPNLFKQYESAIKAAIEKANCYHCREAHYAG